MDALLPLPSSGFTTCVYCRANYVVERNVAQDRASWSPVMFVSIGTDPPPTGIGLSFLFLLMYLGMLMPRSLKKRA